MRTFAFFIFAMAAAMSAEPADSFWNFQGWAGKPDAVEQGKLPSSLKPEDYFYSPIETKGAPGAIAAHDPEKIMRSCRMAAKVTGPTAIYEKFMQGALNSISPPDSKGTVRLLDSKGAQTYQCDFYRSPGLSLTRCAGKISNGILACRLKTKDQENSQYGVCQCIAYIYFEGGRDSLKDRLRLN